MNTEKTLIAMSGGVDSSVVAALLSESSEELVGVTMRVWDAPAGALAPPNSCCSADDTDDARRVAHALGIPHYTLNVKEDFKEKVVDYFVDEYLKGRTPNPCILCNQAVKFDYLFRKGASFGATKVATGHYARIGEYNNRPALFRGLDKEKDQSYFLFSIDRERLSDILFPLGGFTKEETRAIAKKHGLLTAKKAESQEICFVPDNDYKNLVRQVAGDDVFSTGEIISAGGVTLGRHKGYPAYTVGQRRGLGISHKTPLYVTGVDPEANQVIVGEKDELMGRALLASNVNWLVPKEEALELDTTARLRHGHKDAKAEVKEEGDDSIVVTFVEKQLAITPGQAVVFYHGDLVLGGGWIEKRLD